MNLNLATQPTEEQVKLAEAELFTKLATSQGIDLSSLSDAQVVELWNATFSKEAAEDEEAPKDEEKEEAKAESEEKAEEEKKEAAAREHAIKVAHAEEEARSVKLGQIMAHAYVAEVDKIAAARASGEGETKEAGMPPQLANALGKVRGAAGKGKELAGKAVGAAKENKKGLAAAGAGAAAVGAGFAAGRMSKKASVSNIDGLALDHAVKLAESIGLDAETAAARVNAVATLGLEDSDKLASDLDSQVHIRALEYLEAAGYQVSWDNGEQS